MRIKINKNGKETIIDVNNKYIKEVDQEINIDDSDDRIIQINKNKINKGRSIKNKLNSALPLLCTAIFLLLGFEFKLWHPGWLIFLLIPLVPTFMNVFSSNKKSSWMSLITLLTIVTYITLGFSIELWHPTWIMFFIIPIAAIFID